ncbi:MAG: hypothetical protein A4E57_03352 [Syntrophorhabdaceae bacterium PtaU1.Bin034]|jgi:CRISPR-associated protein Csm4|nr:MAG: hypothetical protein A4E57_03352 [Syntrophorhabdaceae bacterium PtaU1.Bin034]
MKVFTVIIKPTSGVGTPLKGDTLFGHICWQAAYDESLFGSGISALLADYADDPFLVMSSAFPVLRHDRRTAYAFKKPDLPLRQSLTAETDEKKVIEERKKAKKKRWLLLKSEERLNTLTGRIYVDDEELVDIVVKETAQTCEYESRRISADRLQPRNTINRFTGTTGEGQFAPFSVGQTIYHPCVVLALFFGVSDRINAESVVEALRHIGQTGFGKDASVGWGRFDVLTKAEEFSLADLGHPSPDGCYTLAPCVPEKGFFRKTYYTPFVRYGRHGDIMAKSSNPFKDPVLMADEGAVFVPDTRQVFDKPYIGRALTGLSKVNPSAVAQGYALYIPVRVED